MTSALVSICGVLGSMISGQSSFKYRQDTVQLG